MLKPEFRTRQEHLRDVLDVLFEVTIGYYSLMNGETSIEWYELDGHDISREELVVLFGEDKLKAIETDLE